jgi:hypothetical protein
VTVAWAVPPDHSSACTRAQRCGRASGRPLERRRSPYDSGRASMLRVMGQSQELPDGGGDPLLSLFASLVSDTDAEIHVTLAVAGGVVTGALISQVKWMRLSAETMNATVPGSGVIPDELARMLVTETSEGTPHEYLHLKDARYIGPTGMIPERPQMLWRGRISEVAGWSWGSFQVS